MGRGGLTTLLRCSQRILQTPRELGREKEILTPLAFQWIVKFW